MRKPNLRGGGGAGGGSVDAPDTQKLQSGACQAQASAGGCRATVHPATLASKLREKQGSRGAPGARAGRGIAQPGEDRPEGLGAPQPSLRLTWEVPTAPGSGAPRPAAIEQDQVPLVQLLAAQGVRGQVTDLQPRELPQEIRK